MSEETKVQQNTDEEELLKTVPSILENKFADFTYRFVKYVPMSVHPNVVTGIGLVCGLFGAFCFFLGSFSRLFLRLFNLPIVDLILSALFLLISFKSISS